MSAKNTITVLIGGKVTRLSGYESEEYLQRVATYLNRKTGELSELKGYNRMPADQKSTLLALNIADDYFKAKKQADALDEDLQEKDREIYDLKQRIVDLQVQLAEWKRAQGASAPEVRAAQDTRGASAHYSQSPAWQGQLPEEFAQIPDADAFAPVSAADAASDDFAPVPSAEVSSDAAIRAASDEIAQAVRNESTAPRSTGRSGKGGNRASGIPYPGRGRR